MRRVLRWRFYCDHCHKSGSSGGHMSRHERHCVRNPERVCGACDRARGDQQPIADLIAALGGGDATGVARLRKFADGCPACMLATIVQSGLQRRGDWRFSVEFDYAAEKERFWAEHNDLEAAGR